MNTQTTYRTLAELTPAHWTRDSVEANGIRIHFIRTGGDKPPLLLMHGFQMDGLTWMRVAKALESDYDIIMPDARGHGRTGNGAQGAGSVILVEDTAAFIRALRLEPLVVIGHSMGADVAGRLALAHPDLVKAVVLVDPALQVVNPGAWMESDGYKAWYDDWLAYLEKMRSQSHAERVKATLARQMPGITPTHEEDFVTHMEASLLLDMNMLSQVATMNNGATALIEVLVEATTPKLVLLAQPPKRAYGFSNRVEERDDLQSRWQNGEVIVFEETGHFIQGERLEEFVSTVRGWLGAAIDN
jgi:N-formylmaleamate deformylase